MYVVTKPPYLEKNMNKYDLIERMNTRFAELEVTLHQLHQQLDDLPLIAARVFSLPEIEKGTEHQPIEQITVNITEGEHAKKLGLALLAFFLVKFENAPMNVEFAPPIIDHHRGGNTRAGNDRGHREVKIAGCQTKKHTARHHPRH